MICFLQEVSVELEFEKKERELLQRLTGEDQNVEKYFVKKILGEDRMVI